MNPPQLQSFDLAKLSSTINSILPDLFIDGYEPCRSAFKPLLYYLYDRQRTSIGKHDIYLTGKSGSLLTFLGCESFQRIGALIVETGTMDAQTEYQGSFERVTLKFRESLKLGNTIIPPCKIDLEMELRPDITYEPRRLDYLKTGLGWAPTDLSSILPTEWFITEN